MEDDRFSHTICPPIRRAYNTAQQVERHAYVFDRKTGEILATHTRWTDAGAELAQRDVDPTLLESIATDSERTVKDLDVLQTKPRTAKGRLRVDVKTRKVLVDRAGENENTLLPAPPRRP